MNDETTFAQIQDELFQLRQRISRFPVSDSLSLAEIVKNIEEAQNEAWRAEKMAILDRKSKIELGVA